MKTPGPYVGICDFSWIFGLNHLSADSQNDLTKGGSVGDGSGRSTQRALSNMSAAGCGDGHDYDDPLPSTGTPANSSDPTPHSASDSQVPGIFDRGSSHFQR